MKFLNNKSTMKLTSCLLVLGFFAISLCDFHGGWQNIFGRNKTTPRPVFPGTSRRVPIQPVTQPPQPSTRPATRPQPSPTRPATRPPPPPPAKPVTIRPTPPAMKPTTRSPVFRPSTAVPLPPMRPSSRPPPIVTNRPTPRPIVNTPKPVVVVIPGTRPGVVPNVPVVDPINPPVQPPTRPVVPPTIPFNSSQPITLNYKPLNDVSCYFGDQTCNYTIENANQPSFQGIKPKYDNTIAWIRSNVTAGDGPYCLKVQYMSTTETSNGALNGEKVMKTNITILMVTPDDGKTRKLYEFTHRSRAFEIRSGE